MAAIIETWVKFWRFSPFAGSLCECPVGQTIGPQIASWSSQKLREHLYPLYKAFFSPFTGFHTPNDFFFFFLKKVRNNLKLPSFELILLSLTWFISSLVFVYSEYQLGFAKRLLKFGEPLWEFFFWVCNNKTRNTAAKVCQRSAWISLLSEKVQAK